VFPMVPLAVSGVAMIGVVVIAALVLLWVLLRSEARVEAEEEAKEAAATGPDPNR
jgi:hypothetical protein